MALPKKAIAEALLEVNAWHQNVPLLLVFSRQRPGPEGEVAGNVSAVRAVYDSLFNLELVGIEDPSQEFYLHLCHGSSGVKEYPYALRKPTSNYGKTHQRIIKDTFANADGFLTRIEGGRYKLKAGAGGLIKAYLKRQDPIDLRPLLLLLNWSQAEPHQTVGDLWLKFEEEFGVTEPPFSEVFTCSGREDELPADGGAEFADVRSLFLPDEYGTGNLDAAFWNRFRVLLTGRLDDLKWQGDKTSLVTGVTTALMHDQAVFLLGAPGTGKTSIVSGAIVPALREARGSDHPLRFSQYSLTPSTTQADLFGFQGLDGDWVEGPFVRDVLIPLQDDASPVISPDAQPNDGSDLQSDQEAIPHLVFFDEANRVDIEGLLAFVQPAFDRLQARNEAGIITLGLRRYVMPKRVWRIFAGNSPSADTGRRVQSRPFKRRLSVVFPPNPVKEIVGSASRFKSMALDLLERAKDSPDPEVRDPSLAFLGDLEADPAPLEDLRAVLEVVVQLPRVAMTIGLMESLLLRASAARSQEETSPIDMALFQSLPGLLEGDAATVELLKTEAASRGFVKFADAIGRDVLGSQSVLSFEIDPIL